MTPDEIIEALALEPHPEGGHFRETWRHREPSARGAGTAIYHFLRAGERSHWHRVDATEIWHFYAGAPIKLSTYREGEPVAHHRLGPDLRAGQRPQIVIAPHVWQAARSLGEWTLVGCTVSPAFEFEHFELAPPGWRPPGR
ncbi:MAG: cupin domain-containing protein [Myxococcota bacterium]